MIGECALEDRKRLIEVSACGGEKTEAARGGCEGAPTAEPAALASYQAQISSAC